MFELFCKLFLRFLRLFSCFLLSALQLICEFFLLLLHFACVRLEGVLHLFGCFLLSALQLSGKLGLSLTHFRSAVVLLTLELFCKLFLRFLHFGEVVAADFGLLGVSATDFV